VTATTDEPGAGMCGVRPGEPCWLVHQSEPMVPVFCPAAVFVSGYGLRYVLHAGRAWHAVEVFRDEAVARGVARDRAGYALARDRACVARAEAALRELGGET